MKNIFFSKNSRNIQEIWPIQLKFFFIISFLLICCGLLILLPQTKIEISFSPQPLVLNFPFNLSEKISQVNVNLAMIPARRISLLSEPSALDGYIYLEDLKDQTNQLQLIYKRDDIVGFIKQKLDNVVPKNQQVVDFSFDHWQLIVQKKDLSTGWAEITAIVKEETIPLIDENLLRESVVGMTLVDAEKILETFQVAKSSFKVWPTFWNRLPVLKERIHVILTKN
jgi:hypothetical protein